MANKNNTATIDFQTRESAQRVTDIVKSAQLTQLYTTSFTVSISEADNRVIKGKNKISVLNEEETRRKAIVKALRLDEAHEATSRIEVWVDKTQIVAYVGATFNVTATLAEKHSEAVKELYKAFAKLHTETRDTKWRYAKSCETRHIFKSFEQFETFYTQLSQLISAQLTYEAEEARKKAEEEAKKAEEKAKKSEEKKTRTQRSKAKKSEEKKA